MSEKTTPIETEILPSKSGGWTADTNAWMKVGCSIDSTGSTLKFVPQAPQWINFSIWKDATKFEKFDLQEPDWKSLVFTHASHLTGVESATLTLYQDQEFWEKNILPDLSGNWKTLEYLLPSQAPEGYWKKSGSPTKIKYILFKFYGKSGVGGSFEVKDAHLVHAPPKKPEDQPPGTKL
jgi:hypothetical protein